MCATNLLTPIAIFKLLQCIYSVRNSRLAFRHTTPHHRLRPHAAPFLEADQVGFNKLTLCQGGLLAKTEPQS
jgi:hypothetical protein